MWQPCLPQSGHNEESQAEILPAIFSLVASILPLARHSFQISAVRYNSRYVSRQNEKNISGNEQGDTVHPTKS